MTGPPRRPLRVRQDGHVQAPNGSAFFADAADAIVWPGDPQYEAEYAQAADAYHTYGRPMPYASPEDLQSQGAGNLPPASDST